jgi:hypothetical protein
MYYIFFRKLVMGWVPELILFDFEKCWSRVYPIHNHQFQVLYTGCYILNFGMEIYSSTDSEYVRIIRMIW